MSILSGVTSIGFPALSPLPDLGEPSGLCSNEKRQLQLPNSAEGSVLDREKESIHQLIQHVSVSTYSPQHRI